MKLYVMDLEGPGGIAVPAPICCHLSVEETAEVLGVSTRTVKRDWNVAKAWLRRQIDEG